MAGSQVGLGPWKGWEGLGVYGVFGDIEGPRIDIYICMCIYIMYRHTHMCVCRYVCMSIYVYTYI